MFNVWMLLRSVDNLLKDKLEETVNVLCSLFDLALFSWALPLAWAFTWDISPRHKVCSAQCVYLTLNNR